MTFYQRAASLAAMTLIAASLIGTTPSLASGLDRTPVIPATTTPVTIVTPLNTATVQPVPSATTETVADDDAAPEYASLAAAVDAQDDAAIAGDDAEALTCLAGAIYFESKGEPLSGQLAVADVIINRAKSGRFPTSICDVVKQRGQFSFVHHGEIPSIDESRAAYRTALGVARIAMADAWDSPAEGALFFHARRAGAPARTVRVASIGNHVFYR